MNKKHSKKRLVHEKSRNSDNTIINFDDNFMLIDAEGLSIDDEFMQHEPRTDKEKATKELILKVIEKGVKNFYRPIYDPSFTDDGKGICFLPNRTPAEGNNYYWWSDAAENYCPSRNSRLGTKLQYGAFLGVLMKKLVEEGKSIDWVWNAVCNDSRELGNYAAYEVKDDVFELTGSRNVCGFFDLANTYKILKYEDEIDSFWLASGSCHNRGDVLTIGYIQMKYIPIVKLHGRDYRSYNNSLGSGWIVLS